MQTETIKKSYFIPASETIVEQEIKRNRFITYISEVENNDSAQQYIRQIREQHPKARHHCYGYIAGDPHNTTQCGMSDDGEPSGTAGKPMLNVLQHSGLGNIAAVVVRYSSGIKLGTGGLVRAYSSSVQNGLDELKTIEVVPRKSLTMSFPYNCEVSVRNYIETHDIVNLNASYSDKVSFACDVPANQFDLIKDEITERLNGQVYFS